MYNWRKGSKKLSKGIFENRIAVQKYSSPIILCQIKCPKYRKHGVSGGLKMAVLVCINNARL